MLWKNRRGSSNIEDRRGRGIGGGAAVGGGGLLIVVVLALLFGADPQELLQQIGSGDGATTGSSAADPSAPPDDPHQEELKQFVAVVLADTEDVWSARFSAMGRQYEPPTLVLFSGGVHSACGQASSATGPFYCPADANVYLDLTFLDELSTRFGAHGDFPAAYVIAHEIGHHVQHQLGLTEKADALRGRVSEAEMNEMSVRLELQADFLAGVWAHDAQSLKGVLEPGDIEEALAAASSIGDDRLQERSQGYAVPDSFTHGTSAQRMRWFRLGYETGDLSRGDTFSAKSL